MGLLYETVMEQKKKFLIERLTERKIFTSQSGKSIYDCDYEELKYELVLSEFRDIDVNSDANKWY